MSDTAIDFEQQIIHYPPRNKRQEQIKDANPDLLSSLRRYVWDGDHTGDFLRAVIADKLVESVMYADRSSMSVLGPLAQYTFHDMPSPARGSFEEYREWRNGDGLVGRHGQKEAAEYAQAIGI